MAEYHRDIAQLIKAQYPTASIGGSVISLTDFAKNDFSRFNDNVKTLIQTAGQGLDFYSMHPYERYDVRQDGSWSRTIAQSPGRVSAMIDLVQNQHEAIHGDRRKLAFTEYGSWNLLLGTDLYGDPSIGNYARDHQQWNLSNNIRDKVMVLLNRPDAVLNATPFVQPRDWRNEVQTHPEGDNVFWERDENRDWQETILASMFRSFAPIKGNYIGVSGDNTNIQQVDFRDRDTFYLVLNNMLTSNQQLDLQLLAGQFGTVTTATVDRIFRTAGGVNTFVDHFDITATFQDFELNSEEGAVITFTLDNADGLLTETDERTFYGDQVVSELANGGEPDLLTIVADTDDAFSASLRIGFNRTSNSPEAFDIMVNGNLLMVGAGDLGINDGDLLWFSRTVDVPLKFLVDGSNLVQVHFAGDGGYVSSAALSLIVAIPEPSSFFIVSNLSGFAVMRRRRAG